MQWWSGFRPGELSTLPKTLSWMREQLRAEKGKMEHKGVKGNWGKYEMGRGGEVREKRGKVDSSYICLTMLRVINGQSLDTPTLHFLENF